MASKGKRTFWVSGALTPLHLERCQLLAQNGFDIQMMSSTNEVIKALAASRPVAIVIDTPIMDNVSGVQTIQTLSTMPEMNGVRFILSVTAPSPEASRVAMSENFRDIIPMNIHSSDWLQRVQFATGAKPTGFPSPLCEISMNQMAVALAPGRIIWINDTHIRIECRGGQRVGSSMQITGALAKTFGVPHISLTVESIHKTQLLFRFSQALVCRWRIAQAQAENASSIIRLMGQQNNDARIRAFVAVSRPDIRKAIVGAINPERFAVKVALQKSTLAQELSYYSPDLVFIDARMIAGPDAASMQTIFATLPGDVPVIIYGSSIDQSLLKKTFGSRPVFVETSVNLPDINNAAHRYRVVHHAAGIDDTARVNPVSPDNPWSKTDIMVPARLTSLNPSSGEISLPYSLGAFAMARLEAPILRRALGRDPYIKITDMVERTSSLQASQFTHHAHFYLADVESREQVTLCNVLVTMLSDYYQKQFVAAKKAIATANVSLVQASAATVIRLNAVGSTAVSTSAPLTAGNLALKEPQNPPPPPAPRPEVVKQEQITDQEVSLTPETLNTKLRRGVFQHEIEFDFSFNWRKHVDITVLKAVGAFFIAAGIMAFIISLAMNIDESYYKEHGREYSDFFIRMTDPEFRKKHPAPGMPQLDRNNKNGN